MRIFRHKNGFLYSIAQIGRGRCISPRENWRQFKATPYWIGNEDAPDLPLLGENPNLDNFKHEFTI